MAGTESNIKDREQEDAPFVNNKKKTLQTRQSL